MSALSKIKTVRATVCLLSVICVVAIDTPCYKMLGILGGTKKRGNEGIFHVVEVIDNQEDA
jgi:hypothetical protein